jgi:hypothetical protein
MKNETVKTGMKIGAVVGGILWMVFGIMARLYCGSYGPLIILQQLMGGTVEPSLIARAIIVAGSVVGIATTATVSIVTGGLVGTALGFLVAAPQIRAEKKAEVKIEA